MPLAEREAKDIDIAVAYTLDQAIQRVDRGAINVRNAVVVVDNLTNDTRGTKLRLSLTPEGLVRGLNQLLQTLRAAGAKTILTCQVKPMLIKDVKPYNKQLSDYLRGQGWGSEVPTQIRPGHLRPDGFHVRPQFHWIIDKAYADAILAASAPHDGR